MKKSRKIIIGALILISAVCVVLIGLYFRKQESNEKIYEELQTQVEEVPEPSEAEEEDEAEGVEIPIDFEELAKVNPEIYAWIQIDGTNVNYPIVQSAEDDGYYLMRTVERKEGYPGSIYTESCNKKDFSDFNTLIYGHDMADGSMFQNLHNYSDPVYMKDHPEIIIYTPEKKLTYRIFAAIVYDDRHIMKSFDFQNSGDRQNFLDSVYAVRDMSSVIDREIPVDTDSRIITLSTCIGGQENNRFLVGAVLQNEEKKKAE